MINFLQINKAIDPRWLKVRKTALTLTTIGLVIYVVGIAAWVGWWWYTMGRERQVTAEARSLAEQANNLATREILVRQLDNRAGEVISAVGVDKLSDLATKLQEASVAAVSWDNVTVTNMSLPGKTTFGVAGADPSVLQTYAQKVKNIIPLAREGLITWNKGAGWLLYLVWGEVNK